MHYMLVATLSVPMEGRLHVFEQQTVIHITTFVKLCWHLCHIITGAVAISIMDEVHIPQRKDYPQDRIVHYGSLQR